jgi:hypothetical protein
MKAMIRVGTALVGVLAAVVPAQAATANPIVGGQTVSAGPCDVTLAEIRFDEQGNVEQVTIGYPRCEVPPVPPVPPVPAIPPIPPLPDLR